MNYRDIARAALSEAMDAAPSSGESQPQSVDMQKHDAKYHPNGFDPSKDTCLFRNKLANGDNVDDIDPENIAGEAPQKPTADKVKTDESASEKAFALGEKISAKIAETASSSTGFDPSRASAWGGVIAKAPNPVVAAILEKVKAHEEKHAKPKGKSAEDLKKEALLSFAKGLGLDLSNLGAWATESAISANVGGSSPQSQGAASSQDASVEKVREMMRSLASPSLAARLNARLANLSSGAPASNGTSAKPATKRRTRPMSSSQTTASQSGNGQQPPRLDTLDELKPGKANILSKSDFKKFYADQQEQNKILAISDLHDTDWMDKVKLDGRGTVLIAGDLGEAGATSESKGIGMDQAVANGRKWLDEKFIPHIKKHPNQKFVIIPGNRDHFLADPSMADYPWPENVSFLNDSEANVNGMRVYGMPWCEERKGKHAYGKQKVAVRPFEISDDELQKHCDSVPEGLDVLMLHMPPKFDGYDGDMAGGEHCGSEIIAKMIERVKPKLVIAGHLHDGSHAPFRVNDDTVLVHVGYAGGSGHSTVGAKPRKLVKTEGSAGVGFVMSEQDMKK